MKAVKGNKEYSINEAQKKNYMDNGFDIIGDDGSVISYGRGKTVPYDDYMEAVKEIEHLRKIISDMRSEEKPAEEKPAEEKPTEKKTAKKAGE